MLAQANRLDNGEIIEGYYSPTFFMCMGNGKSHVINTIDEYQYEIDSKTLKYSFDNGENWYSEDEIRGRIKYCNTFVSKYSIDE